MSALTILPFALLLAAVLGLWIHRLAWITALTAAIATAYYTGALHGLAALWVAIAAGLGWFYAWARGRAEDGGGRSLQAFAGILFFIYALALSLALLPGFHRVVLVPAQVLSESAEPYDIAVGFPKVVCGIFILGLINPVSRGGLGAALSRALPIFLFTTVAAMAFTLAVGYTAFAPKWTTLFLLWAPINLFFTCLAEEAFFRGYVQQELASVSAAKFMPLLALVIAAVLFGLAHFKGGGTYMWAGLIAGLGYGWAFHRTQRVEAAMAVHFGLNATHFLLFIYPRIA